MTTIARRRIRLEADLANDTSTPMIDLASIDQNATPDLWRGNDLQVEVAFFRNGTLVSDLSNIASVTLNVKSTGNRDGTPLMTATLEAADLDDTLTAETWADETKQHALFTFTAAETNITLDGNDDDCWLAIGIVTNDDPGRNITVGYTILKVVEDGIGGEGDPQNNAELYYTKDEADARHVQKHADQAWMQFANGVWYIYEATTEKWYPLKCTIVDTVPTLTLGNGVANP